MEKGPTGFVIAAIAIAGLLLGCNPTASEKIATPDHQGDRYFQRTVSDYQGLSLIHISEPTRPTT